MSEERRTRAQDEPEAQMASDVEVLHRDKGIVRGTLGVAVVFGSLLGGTATANVIAGAPLWTLAVPALIAATVGVFGVVQGVVRTAVTRDEVIVRAGVRGRRIPISSITSAAVVPSDRIAPTSVRIDYEAEGRAKTFRFASQDPQRLVAAIENARRRGVASVRVASAEEEHLEADPAEDDARSERARARG